MMRLCCRSRPLCSLVSKPRSASAAALAARNSVCTTVRAVCSNQAPPTADVTDAGAKTVINATSALWRCAAADVIPKGSLPLVRFVTTGTGIDPGVIPGPPGIDPGTNPLPGISPRQPGIDPGPGVPGIDPGIDPGVIPNIDPKSVPGGVPDPGVSPGIDPTPPGVDPGRTPGSIDPGVYSPGDPGRMEASASAETRPHEGSFPADLGSEAIAVDDATIDAIPDSAMPAGAARTPGPGATRQYSTTTDRATEDDAETGTTASHNQPEINPEAGDPRPDASGPPSGQPGSNMEAEEPLVGKSRTSGPEMEQNPASPAQQPEMPESANPDRMPFWGS